MNPEEQNNQNITPAGAPETAAPMQTAPASTNPEPVVSPAAAPAPAPKKTGKLIAIIVIVLLILAGAGYGAYAMFGKDDKKADTTSATNISGASQTTEPTNEDDSTAPKTALDDSARKAAVSSLAADLETYYSKNGYYPTLEQLKSSSFSSTNLATFNKTIASSTKTQAMTISGTLGNTTFAYAVTPSGCNNTSKTCTKYEVSVKTYAKQTDGSYTYKKSSMN